MKKIIFLLLTTLIINDLKSQFGVSAAFGTYEAEKWVQVLSSSELIEVNPTRGFNIGLDYWLRLKKKRIELMPEISAGQYKETYDAADFTARFFNFRVNTNFYILDFGSDCNCPTFSKQGNFFSKGFFVQLSPAIRMVQTIHETEDLTGVIEKTDNTLSYGAGVGAGLDIGLSDLITVTPLVRFSYFPFVKSSAIPPFETEMESNIKQIYAGLRIGFRWKKDW